MDSPLRILRLIAADEPRRDGACCFCGMRSGHTVGCPWWLANEYLRKWDGKQISAEKARSQLELDLARR